jgi:probable phosphoglycerate mutase
MTHFILTRHGESIWHQENRYAGKSDIGLTPHGYQEAARLADWAQSARLDAIWVSPLVRARETAAPTASKTGLTPHIDARLREVDFGIAEGKTAAELEQTVPEILSAFREDPVTHAFPESEDPQAAAVRTIACLQEIAHSNPTGRILVVMHNTLLRLTLCQLIGIPLARYRNIFPRVTNCSLTEITLEQQRASILMFNAPLEAHPASTATGSDQAAILHS